MLQNQHMILDYSGAVQGLIVPQYKLYSIASIVLHPIHAATLNFIIEGFSSCCPPERCLIIFFLDNTI